MKSRKPILWSVVAACVLTVACSNIKGGPGSDGGYGFNQLSQYQSGSRIRMIVGTTPDGAKQFRGWFDSALNVKCEFKLAADGVTRCIPISVVAIGPYYSNSDCNEEIMLIGKNCRTMPTYILKGAGEVAFCKDKLDFYMSTQSYRVFQLEGEYTGSKLFQKTYRLEHDGGMTPLCKEVDINREPYKFYFNGSEVPPETFQSMTDQIE